LSKIAGAESLALVGKGVMITRDVDVKGYVSSSIYYWYVGFREREVLFKH